MPIRVRCSACATQYNLAETLAGKKIRCKKCEGVIAVPAAQIEEVTEVVAADESAPPAKKTTDATSKTRPAAVRANENDDDEKPRAKRRRDEDDEDEKPRAKRRRDEDEDDDDEPRLKKKKMSRGLMIGISVGAVVLLAGIGVAIYFMVSGPTLRGERELKELIKAKKEADAEKDLNKKLEAQVKQLGLMMAIEQLRLTEEEQNKLKEKYSSQWAELGMDKLLASQNVAKKKEEQKTPPKNDVDSLLAELKTTDPFIKKTEAIALIKRLSDNIPVDSPRRSEVFMALRNAATSRSFDTVYASDCTRAAIRYADTGDADELLKMMQQRELEGNITFSNLIADRLAELKNPKVAEEVALALTNYDINRRRRAAKILRGLGESAEKLVQKSAAPSGNFTGPDLNRRFEAIELLGEIGTQDSLTFLLAMKKESPPSSEWIADAIKKIRERKGEKTVKDPDPVSPSESSWKVRADPAVPFQLADGARLNLPLDIDLGWESRFSSTSSPFVVLFPPRKNKTEFTAQVFDVRSGKPTGQAIALPPITMAQRAAGVGYQLALSSDGTALACREPSSSRKVILFAAETGAEMTRIQVGSNDDERLTFFDFAGPDQLLTAKQHKNFSYTTYELWNAKTGEKNSDFQLKIGVKGSTSVKLSPNRRFLAVLHYDPHRVSLFDLTTGTLAGEAPIPKTVETKIDNVYTPGFSQDGQQLALLCYDQTDKENGRLVIWNMADGKVKSDCRVRGSLVKRRELIGSDGAALQSLADGSSWLICNKLFVDAEKGSQYWSLPLEQTQGSGYRSLLLGSHYARVATDSKDGTRKFLMVPLPRTEMEAAQKKAP